MSKRRRPGEIVRRKPGSGFLSAEHIRLYRKKFPQGAEWSREDMKKAWDCGLVMKEFIKGE